MAFNERLQKKKKVLDSTETITEIIAAGSNHISANVSRDRI